MYTCMNPWAIGIELDWEACLPLAKEAGFGGIDVPINPQISAAWYQERLAQYGLKPGGMGLPIHMADPDSKFAKGLAKLPAICQRAQQVGQTRFYTWILPFSDHLPWKENFHLHVERLGKAARILADQGCRLGLEFIGPRSVREGHRYSFVHTLQEMLGLCEAVGPNVGLLLDAWHWYTSLGIIEELYALQNQQVVYIHISDAPAGVPIEKQQDLVRRLPGATGIIDLPGFLKAMQAIGYDGPVVPEPFEKALSDMAPAQAARQVGEAMRSVWPEISE
jgi:sugar phosphate isomerase/epimerase